MQSKLICMLFTLKHKCKVDLSEISAQDTCVALQALSEYAILSYVGGVNLTISLASTNLDFQETFELNKDNKKLLQSAKVIKLWFSLKSFCTVGQLYIMPCCLRWCCFANRNCQLQHHFPYLKSVLFISEKPQHLL